MEEYTSKNDIGLDKDVLLASEKKITLQPVHDDVHIDDESDVQVAATHANGAPIGNIASDRESTNITEAMAEPDTHDRTPLATSATGVQHSHHKRYVSVVVMGVVIAALVFALLYR